MTISASNFFGILAMLAMMQGIAQAQSPGPFYLEYAPLPEPVTNNAVCAAMMNDTPYVYSFMGMDSSKIWSGIHLKAWRLNTISDVWEQLPTVPSTTTGGRIAGAASTVKNRIYVIGGYHVAQNGSESSSNKLHRFDPQTNSWLSDGVNIPKAIDDHVQAVWRDSLIFVVTGWSNTANVTNVQIYNPATDTWSVGTPVPNTNDYKVFGASGIIKGDSLFYIGGAGNGSNFPATSVLRKGYINPNNPTQITWSATPNPLAKGYRMAAATMAGGITWFGGSDVTYNYDGIAYNGSGGVEALPRAKTYYDHASLGEINASGIFPEIMDLRGAAQITPDYFVIAGGMGLDQKVSDKVYGISWQVTLDAPEILRELGIRISPNPASNFLRIESPQHFRCQLMNNEGKIVREISGSGELLLELGGLANGLYLLGVWDKAKLRVVEKVLLQQ